ncbi:peptidase S8/S53 domain-containing protein [Catenaria anguillulae PL171]|uniref:Peptidase S8/S53 domain-containing protein n=1 Tax=Catenaria anguillulae PL171 TaxID=765915 RepID=A0A1Y2HTE9_9FUNG|nr:peptidase S8/S53 domain-containing protein [Catenaria anguillulae PL171]
MARRTIKRTLLLVMLAAMAMAGTVHAANEPTLADLPEDLPAGAALAKNQYIVQFSRPAAADRNALSREGASPQSLARAAAAQHASFTQFAQRNKVGAKVSRTYQTLFNGAAVTVDSSDDLKKLSAALAIYPIITYPAPELKPEALSSTTVYPQYAHNLTNVNLIRERFPDMDGRGVKVAVVDTGIDWKHPAFAEKGKTCTTWRGPCRVLYGRDLVGDGTPSAPTPDSDPMDCNGHGTHVGGIIGGADDKIEGVAPNAVLGGYRVFGCSGSTSTAIILSGLEAAYQDGMEIINLPSRGLAIASFDNSHIMANAATVQGVPNTSAISFSAGAEGPKFEEGRAYPIIRSPANATSVDDGCTPYPAGTFKDGAALIRRGGCAFPVKANNARNAGAIAAVIWNNLPGDLAGAVDETVKIPVAFISGVNGAKVFEAATAADKVKIAFKYELQGVPSVTAGMPSDFSSWGLDLNLLLKPDVGAPGGNIYSAYPTAMGTYAQLSGTSMATPYMAGVTALYVQKFGASQGPESFDEFQRRVHITARPSSLKDGRELAESVAKVGAGMVDALALLTNEIDVSPSKLELGDSPGWPRAARKTATLTIRNNGKDTKTYRLTHTPSRAIMPEGGRLTAQFGTAEVYARVQFSTPFVTLKPGTETTVRVTIDPNVPLIGKLPEPGKWVYSGYVTLQTEDRQNQLSVPYAVMTGDYSTFTVLPAAVAQTGPTAPFLTDGFGSLGLGGPVYNSTVVPAFDLTGTRNVPAVRFSTLLPVRKFALSVHNAADKSLVGYMSVNEYLNQVTTGLSFRGTVLPNLKATERVPVPNGRYFIALHYVRPSALKLPTDLDAALFKAWESPVFEIARRA